MPCVDDYGRNDGVPQTQYDRLEADRNVIKKRLDRATRIACEVEKLLSPDQAQMLSQDALKWIAEHREADAKRAREDAARAERDRQEKARRAKLERDRTRALKKLTPAERNVLGLPHPAKRA